MKHTISVLQRRAFVIVEEMGGKALILTSPDEDGYVRIEVEINNSIDLLNLYHAGVSNGMQLCREASREASRELMQVA